MCTRFYTISTLFCQREECCEKLTQHCSFRSTESSDEKLSPEDIAKIQRNRVAAMVRRFAHYLKEPQWKERLQPGTHPSPLSLSLSLSYYWTCKEVSTSHCFCIVSQQC
jgi:hypothetical protein